MKGGFHGNLNGAYWNGIARCAIDEVIYPLASNVVDPARQGRIYNGRAVDSKACCMSSHACDHPDHARREAVVGVPVCKRS